MFPLNVLKALLSPKVYNAYLRAKPLDPSEFPDRVEFQRLRHGRVTRETFAILSGVGFATVTAFEKGKIQTPAALMRSVTARRLVSALMLMEQDREQAEAAA